MYTTTTYTPSSTTAVTVPSATKEGNPMEPTVTHLDALSKQAEKSGSRGMGRMGGVEEAATETTMAPTATESAGARESRAGQLLAELKSILAAMGKG
jgi:hypothetical protein